MEGVRWLTILVLVWFEIRYGSSALDQNFLLVPDLQFPETAQLGCSGLRNPFLKFQYQSRNCDNRGLNIFKLVDTSRRTSTATICSQVFGIRDTDTSQLITCKRSGLFRHPLNCQKFYHCAESNLRRVTCQCRDGFFFSENLQQCSVDDGLNDCPTIVSSTLVSLKTMKDDAQSRVCEAESQLPVENSCTQFTKCLKPQFLRYHLQVLYECSKGTYYSHLQQRCINAVPTHCLKEKPAEVQAFPHCMEAGTYQVDCRHYFKCQMKAAGFGFRKETYQCPENTFFDAENERCVFGTTDMCNSRKLKRRNHCNLQQEHAHCSQAGFFRHPNDCRKFVACSQNLNTGSIVGAVKTCPEGLTWSPVFRFCLQPSVTQCNQVQNFIPVDKVVHEVIIVNQDQVKEEKNCNEAVVTETQSEEKVVEVEQESEEKVIEVEQESEEKVVEVEEKVVEVEQQSEEKVVEVEQQSKEKIVEVEQESEEKVIEVKEKVVEVEQQSEEKVVEVEQESEEKVIEVEEKVVEVEQQSEEKVVEVEQQSEEEVIEVEEKVVEVEQQSEEKVVEVEQESEEKVVEVEQQSEEKIVEVEQVSEEKIVEVEQQSEEKVIEVEQESEEKVAEVELESQEMEVVAQQESEEIETVVEEKEIVVKEKSEEMEEIEEVMEEKSEEMEVVVVEEQSEEAVIVVQQESEEMEVVVEQKSDELDVIVKQESEEEIMEEASEEKEVIVEQESEEIIVQQEFEEKKDAEQISEEIAEQSYTKKEETVVNESEQIIVEEMSEEKEIIQQESEEKEVIIKESEESNVRKQYKNVETIVEEEVNSIEDLVIQEESAEDLSALSIEDQIMINEESEEEDIVLVEESMEGELVVNTESLEEQIIITEDSADKEIIITEGSEEQIVLTDQSAEEEIVLTEGSHEEILITGGSAEEQIIIAEDEIILTGESAEEEIVLTNASEEEFVVMGESEEEIILTGESAEDEIILSGESEEEIILKGESGEEEIILTGESVEEEIILTGESDEHQIIINDASDEEQIIITEGKGGQEILLTGESGEQILINGESNEDILITENSAEEEIFVNENSEEQTALTEDFSEEMALVDESSEEQTALTEESTDEHIVINEVSEEHVVLNGESFEDETVLVEGLSEEEITLNEGSEEQVILTDESSEDEVILTENSMEDLLELTDHSLEDEIIITGGSQGEELIIKNSEEEIVLTEEFAGDQIAIEGSDEEILVNENSEEQILLTDESAEIVLTDNSAEDVVILHGKSSEEEEIIINEGSIEEQILATGESTEEQIILSEEFSEEQIMDEGDSEELVKAGESEEDVALIEESQEDVSLIGKSIEEQVDLTNESLEEEVTLSEENIEEQETLSGESAEKQATMEENSEEVDLKAESDESMFVQGSEEEITVKDESILANSEEETSILDEDVSLTDISLEESVVASLEESDNVHEMSEEFEDKLLVDDMTMDTKESFEEDESIQEGGSVHTEAEETLDIKETSVEDRSVLDDTSLVDESSELTESAENISEEQEDTMSDEISQESDEHISAHDKPIEDESDEVDSVEVAQKQLFTDHDSAEVLFDSVEDQEVVFVWENIESSSEKIDSDVSNDRLIEEQSKEARKKLETLRKSKNLKRADEIRVVWASDEFDSVKESILKRKVVTKLMQSHILPNEEACIKVYRTERDDSPEMIISNEEQLELVNEIQVNRGETLSSDRNFLRKVHKIVGILKQVIQESRETADKTEVSETEFNSNLASLFSTFGMDVAEDDFVSISHHIEEALTKSLNRIKALAARGAVEDWALTTDYKTIVEEIEVESSKKESSMEVFEESEEADKSVNTRVERITENVKAIKKVLSTIMNDFEKDKIVEVRRHLEPMFSGRMKKLFPESEELMKSDVETVAMTTVNNAVDALKMTSRRLEKLREVTHTTRTQTENSKFDFLFLTLNNELELARQTVDLADKIEKVSETNNFLRNMLDSLVSSLKAKSGGWDLVASESEEYEVDGQLLENVKRSVRNLDVRTRIFAKHSLNLEDEGATKGVDYRTSQEVNEKEIISKKQFKQLSAGVEAVTEKLFKVIKEMEDSSRFTQDRHELRRELSSLIITLESNNQEETSSLSSVQQDRGLIDIVSDVAGNLIPMNDQLKKIISTLQQLGRLFRSLRRQLSVVRKPSAEPHISHKRINVEDIESLPTNRHSKQESITLSARAWNVVKENFHKIISVVHNFQTRSRARDDSSESVDGIKCGKDQELDERFINDLKTVLDVVSSFPVPETADGIAMRHTIDNLSALLRGQSFKTTITEEMVGSTERSLRAFSATTTMSQAAMFTKMEKLFRQLTVLLLAINQDTRIFQKESRKLTETPHKREERYIYETFRYEESAGTLVEIGESEECTAEDEIIVHTVVESPAKLEAASEVISELSPDFSQVKSVVSSANDVKSNEFICRRDGRYSVKTSCSEFYLCAEGKRGGFHTWKMPCLAAPYFDPKKQQCVDDVSVCSSTRRPLSRRKFPTPELVSENGRMVTSDKPESRRRHHGLSRNGGRRHHH